MLPSAFVPLATFPLTPSGKIDRKSLPAPGEAETLEDTYMAPRSDPERIITEIWKEVLKLEKVGVHNNFFDLGGNSLLMARVNARLVEKFGREIAIIEMFQYPTISALAAHLGEPSGGEPPPDTLDDRARGLAAGRERLRQQRGRRNRGTRSE
jgi:acyl carrier protein